MFLEVKIKNRLRLRSKGHQERTSRYLEVKPSVAKYIFRSLMTRNQLALVDQDMLLAKIGLQIPMISLMDHQRESNETDEHIEQSK